MLNSYPMVLWGGIWGRHLLFRSQFLPHKTIGYEFGTSLFVNFGNANSFDMTKRRFLVESFCFTSNWTDQTTWHCFGNCVRKHDLHIALFSKTSTILLQLAQQRDLDALCTPRIWLLIVDVVLMSSSTSTRGPVNVHIPWQQIHKNRGY